MLYREKQLDNIDLIKNFQKLDILFTNDDILSDWINIDSDDDNQHLFYNQITAHFYLQYSNINIPLFYKFEINGGVLADETGLGKTVCTLALILLNLYHKSSANPKRLTYWQKLLKIDDNNINNIHISCYCGNNSYKEVDNLIFCRRCQTYQHKLCVNYNSNENQYYPAEIQSYNNLYICPSCTKSLDYLINTKTTLIIVPVAILYQWKNELLTHINVSAQFKIGIYKGVSHFIENLTTKTHNICRPIQFKQYDILLTTFNTMRKEIYHTNSKLYNTKNLKRYRIFQSPILKTHFFRICIDESQLVNKNTLLAAKLVNKLNSKYKFLISGTPITKTSHDLYGIMTFLNVYPYNVKEYWSYINKKRYNWLLNTYIWRTNKEYALKQLTIPKQSIITHEIKLSDIEYYYYKQRLKACIDCLDQNILFQYKNLSLSEIFSMKILNQFFELLEECRKCLIHIQTSNKLYISNNKNIPLNTMKLQEITQILINAAKNQAEESLRYLILCNNGVAGINLLKYTNTKNKPIKKNNDLYLYQAIDRYNYVLQFKNIQLDTIKYIKDHHLLSTNISSYHIINIIDLKKINIDQIDLLQTIHAVYNIIDALTLLLTNINHNISHDIINKDIDRCKQLYNKLSNKYTNDRLIAKMNIYHELSTQILKTNSITYNWSMILDYMLQQSNNNFLSSYFNLTDLIDFNKKHHKHSNFLNKLTQIRNINGLQYCLSLFFDDLLLKRQEIITFLNKLKQKPNQRLINLNINCTLCQNNKPSSPQQNHQLQNFNADNHNVEEHHCDHCQLEKKLQQYDQLLYRYNYQRKNYYLGTIELDEQNIMSNQQTTDDIFSRSTRQNVLLHNPNNSNNSKLFKSGRINSEIEEVLFLIQNYINDHLNDINEIKYNIKETIDYIKQLKIELNYFWKSWSASYNYISSLHEVNDCIIRLQLQQQTSSANNDQINELEQRYILQSIDQIDLWYDNLFNDFINSQHDLRLKISKLRYLNSKNVANNNNDNNNITSIDCPICLESKSNICRLICGHDVCKLCCETFLKIIYIFNVHIVNKNIIKML